VNEIRTTSPDATEDVGRRLAAALRGGDVVLLVGDLAAGKTTLVRGLVAGLGGDPDDVSSPTFVLVQTYPAAAPSGVFCVHHLDLYRLEGSIRDLREIGIEEVLNDPQAVVAVEWPKDTIATWMPAAARTWVVRIESQDDGSRRVVVTEPTSGPPPGT
jgi:tRNA threonylcarbamoyl adenosine modification protein YjeE